MPPPNETLNRYRYGSHSKLPISWFLFLNLLIPWRSNFQNLIVISKLTFPNCPSQCLWYPHSKVAFGKITVILNLTELQHYTRCHTTDVTNIIVSFACAMILHTHLLIKWILVTHRWVLMATSPLDEEWPAAPLCHWTPVPPTSLLLPLRATLTLPLELEECLLKYITPLPAQTCSAESIDLFSRAHNLNSMVFGC